MYVYAATVCTVSVHTCYCTHMHACIIHMHSLKILKKLAFLNMFLKITDSPPKMSSKVPEFDFARLYERAEVHSIWFIHQRILAGLGGDIVGVLVP